MPKKKGSKKSKKEVVVEVLAVSRPQVGSAPRHCGATHMLPSLRPALPAASSLFAQRDFGAEFEPVDGKGGELGLEHLEFTRKVDDVAARLTEFQAAMAPSSGGIVDISGLRCHELPATLVEDAEAADGCSSLVASDNLLVGTGLGSLPALRNMVSLDLSANFLVGVGPAVLGELRKLEVLRVGSNKITVIPDEWAGMIMLKELHVESNDLKELPGACIASWPRLAVVDARSNKLTALPDELGACIALRRLVVAANEIAALPDALGDALGLETLDASGNKLTAVPPSLAACSRMRALRMCNNAVADLPAELFAEMGSLRELALHNNKLSQLPASIGSCARLEVLTLSGNGIKSLPDELAGCTDMKEFYCNNNAGLTSMPASLKAWSAIEAVSFKGCKIKGFPEPEEEFAAAWAGTLKHLDVTSKGKKPSCKLPKDAFTDKMYRTTIVGAAEKKVKKSKKGKKKG